MMNHNDFPKMTEEFDRSVRRALDSLPERESKPVRRCLLYTSRTRDENHIPSGCPCVCTGTHLQGSD